MAIREAEIAASAMGINTRNLKLLAFAMGAMFGGASGALFAGFQGFVSPESFSLMESIMVLCMVVLGGMGNIAGSIIAGLMLGLAESYAGGLINTTVRDGIGFTLMILMLLARPQGLFGKTVRV